MKTINLCFAILFLININTYCFCQTKADEISWAYQTENPAEWPLAYDAFLAAPENHEILLENDKVRVLAIKILPGEAENFHHHRWPSVLYIQDSCSFISYDEDKNVLFDTRNQFVPITFPLTFYKNSETIHKVENLSKTKTISMIRVEMKQ